MISGDASCLSISIGFESINPHQSLFHFGSSCLFTFIQCYQLVFRCPHFFYSFFGIPGFRFCCFSIPLGTGRLLGWFCVGGFFRGSCYWRWSWCFTGRPQMPDEDLIELKFRLYDGSDIGPFRYSPTSTIAMVKERIVAEWPKGQWIGSCY